MCDVSVDAHSKSLWTPEWDEGAVIAEVQAATISELAEQMSRYGDLDAKTQRALYLDTPPSLRDQAGIPVQ